MFADPQTGKYNPKGEETEHSEMTNGRQNWYIKDHWSSYYKLLYFTKLKQLYKTYKTINAFCMYKNVQKRLSMWNPNETL